MTIEELKSAYDKAQRELHEAQDKVYATREAWSAARIAAYPYQPGTVFSSGSRIPRAKIVALSTWDVSISVWYVLPKKDGSWGTRKHRLWTNSITVLEPAP